jgi:hypothetical protein
MFMFYHDARDSELHTDCFTLICGLLNTTDLKGDAVWTVDIFSGGFKFSDEIPDVSDESFEVTLSLIALLRRLWAYRVSLVEGEPRADLAPTWESASRLAPHWVGFTPDRCCSGMQPIVNELKSKDLQFAQDIEQLEHEWKSRR